MNNCTICGAQLKWGDPSFERNNNKYYVCATIDGHEVCFSQPYTQYGLTNHIAGTSFTSEQQASLKQAMYQAFINAGINIDTSRCHEYSGAVDCDSEESIFCSINIRGNIECGHYEQYYYCNLDASGQVQCWQS